MRASPLVVHCGFLCIATAGIADLSGDLAEKKCTVTAFCVPATFASDNVETRHTVDYVSRIPLLEVISHVPRCIELVIFQLVPGILTRDVIWRGSPMIEPAC